MNINVYDKNKSLNKLRDKNINISSEINDYKSQENQNSIFKNLKAPMKLILIDHCDNEENKENEIHYNSNM